MSIAIKLLNASAEPPSFISMITKLSTLTQEVIAQFNSKILTASSSEHIA